MEKSTFIAFLMVTMAAVLGQERDSTFEKYQVIKVGGISAFESEEDFITKLNLPLEADLEVLHENTFEETAQVLVSPSLHDRFMDAVRVLKLPHEVLIKDIGWLIYQSNVSRSNIQDLRGEITLERYMEFTEIMSYLQTIALKYSDKIKIWSIGKSFEGEDIHMVTITDPLDQAQDSVKPVVFIEAGIHAREWISVASALHIIDKLSKTTNLTRNVEWRIVPVANPDGYMYSWTKNRLWRKNRSKSPLEDCVGVDLNRNFNPYWRETGASKRPCSNIYAGEAPFSEPETQALKDAVSNREVKDRIKAYVSIHSYGQFILLPPANNKYEVHPKCAGLLKSVGKEMSDAIHKATGIKYTAGNPAKVLYPASGSSMDWALITQKIPLVFTFEMRDKGKSGFLLPDAEIKSTVEDIWVAVNILVETIRDTTTKDANACTL